MPGAPLLSHVYPVRGGRAPTLDSESLVGALATFCFSHLPPAARPVGCGELTPIIPHCVPAWGAARAATLRPSAPRKHGTGRLFFHGVAHASTAKLLTVPAADWCRGPRSAPPSLGPRPNPRRSLLGANRFRATYFSKIPD